MGFKDRNNVEIQKMVDHILEIAQNGLNWARQREAERLDQEQAFDEWGPSDKNDEGFLIEELAGPLPTHLSIIETILLMQSERVGSDEENIERFQGLLSARKITDQFIFNMVAACCDFYAFGWMARHIAGQPPFRHYHTAKRVTSSLGISTEDLEKEQVPLPGPVFA